MVKLIERLDDSGNSCLPPLLLLEIDNVKESATKNLIFSIV